MRTVGENEMGLVAGGRRLVVQSGVLVKPLNAKSVVAGLGQRISELRFAVPGPGNKGHYGYEGFGLQRSK